MSKYDVVTLLSSGSVGRLKRSTETDPFEWEERAIVIETYMCMNVSKFRQFSWKHEWIVYKMDCFIEI